MESLIKVQMPFTAFSPAFSLAVITSTRFWILPMIRVEVSLLLSVEVGGWALVGGKCWNWVEADDCWDWLVGGLGISVSEGELCWCFFWAMVEDECWTWVVVSVGEWLWVWIGITGC